MADDEADRPRIPGSRYHVHDPERPEPPTVDPGRPGTPDTPGVPPSDAVVLFDGSGLDAWEGTDGGAAEWRIAEGTLEVTPGGGDIQTAEAIGDCHLHIEWATPEAVDGEGQGRGNSGVFLMDRYEVQILDCYENETYADGYAGAVYGQQPPAVNACREPGAWQTYDILWRGPRFVDGECRQAAEVTLLHNGVLAQFHTQLHGPTTHSDAVGYEPHPQAAPLRLQDHGDRIRFRNIWYRPLPTSADEPPSFD